MKKIVAAGCLGFSSLMAHAGAMGPVSVETRSLVPYLSGEGSYTWPAFDGSEVNGVQAHLTKNGWGGRLGAGVNFPYSERFGLNAEIGGGYYGQIKSDLSSRGVVANTNIVGYDFLVGGTYHASLVDLFADVGFMAQNMEYKVTRNNALRIPGGLISGIQHINLSQTQMLPEIKVGGVYDLGKNVALSLAYMHAFGSTVTSTSTASSSSGPASVISAGTIEQRNPSLNVVLLGLRYNFA